ncbi:MAG: branched-chain amino acid transaminase [Anaerolineales bacterium]|nr:branched-chain amino acid transaminase [Anaerolineales bacterium]
MQLPNYAYFQGRIVPYAEAKVGVATHALNYGTGAFAGVRGYWNDAEEELYIFRPKDHYKRLLNSAKMLLIELGLDEDDLTNITRELLQKEAHRQDVYIRPLIYKSEEVIGVRLHDLANDITIFSLPFGRYVANDTGAHLTFSSWRRVDDNIIPARGKITGAYANTAFIKTDAMRAGFDEALVLNIDGHLSEGSAENIFMVRDGVLITPPITDNILEGITRRTVITLASEVMGLEVIERSIDRTEVYICDEFFLTGTAAQVTAATKIDHRPIGNGQMGPITAELRVLYDKAVRGKLPQYRHWNIAVYAQESVKT